MFVKPAPWAEGAPFDPETPRVVRYPDHTRNVVRTLPAAGADVPDTAYWARRLRDGDVVLADAPLPPGDDMLKEAPASVEGERIEVTPGADGTTVIAGEHPAAEAEKG